MVFAMGSEPTRTDSTMLRTRPFTLKKTASPVSRARTTAFSSGAHSASVTLVFVT